LIRLKQILSIPLLLAALLLAGCASAPRLAPIAAPPVAELDSAIQRGIDFLLTTQNPDGSWGSARRTKDLNIYAPAPGAHYSYRAATTALCISALIETHAAARSTSAAAALERAEEWLIGFLGKVKRNDTDVLYNVWAHAYGISALREMLDEKPADTARTSRIRDIIAQQVHRLAQCEYIGGGWGYYDFKYQMAQPSGDPASFTTATALVALRDAQLAGVEVPPLLLKRGLDELKRERKPDSTYLYSRNWWVRPMGPINEPGGSLGRSQAGNFTLRLFGDERITDAVLTEWLDRLFLRNGWLSIGRKRPVPHESWFLVAGYFYYYGHYYASLCIDQLPEPQRPAYRSHLARTLLDLQEKDGSWWDYPLYNYHQAYGTAFTLMALQRCRTPPPPIAVVR
jgi:hypothetical protein